MRSNKEFLDGVSVLYVEDDDEIREIISDKLAFWGCDLTVAKNGEDGLKKFKEVSPDLVITDLHMPIMDGLEMISEINKITDHAHIIVLTAHSDSRLLIDSIELGVSRYLVKPIRFDKLKNAIIKVSKNIVLENKLYDAHQHYEALIHFFIVSKTDKYGHITFANDKFCDISGYTEEELIGKPHNIVRHEEMSREAFKDMWSTILAKKVWRGVVKNRKKDGGFYVVDATIFPILSQNGDIKEFMSIRQDITELEQLKIKSKEEQERLKEEEKQKKILEEVNKAKDSFLIVFTHELKTPLNAIINFTEYVKNKISDCKDLENKQKLSSLLESVRRNGAFMLDMVTNLLDIAKLKSGKLQFNYSIFSLNKLIDEIEHSCLPLFELDKIKFIKEIKDEEFFVKSDEVRVKQILLNIISNAIKYGGGVVKVSLFEDSESINVTIEDNGSGIKDKVSVFELYYQEGGDSISREAKGTGVGLYFVKMLSQELGIDVLITDSDTFGGAKFVLKLKSRKKVVL